MKDIRAILDHVSDGIMEIDLSGTIVYCNQKVMRLDDIEANAVVGKPLLAVYPSLDKESSTLFQVLRTGKPIFNREQTFKTYRGKTIATVNTTLPVLKEGQVVGAMEISRDITDVKVMSERIADLQRRVFHSTERVDQALGDPIHFNFDSILTEDYGMARLKEMAKKAALSSSPVLVVGETGTGKELFVQAIHGASSRQSAPFIAQNCAALPANLLEGILFGTADGAFTGAKDRVGLLETANGGTLFLDEINSMPLELQAKLLRFLQDGWLRRLGDNSSRRVDVRVIAAMNLAPKEALDRGQLRQDLFYRLNTITLSLPPLRQRMGDVGLLVQSFIHRFNQVMGKQVRGVTKEVLACFEQYGWPGNVRELEHVIEAAMHLTDDDWLHPQDLPADFQGARTLVALEKEHPMVCTVVDLPLTEAMEAYERQLVRHAMMVCGGNISEASKQLGIPRQTLQSKLKRLL